MTNYFKSIIVGGITHGINGVNLNNNNIFSVTNSSDKKIIYIDENDLIINDKKIYLSETSPNINNSNKIKLTFASSINLDTGKNYLRYNGNCDSGYDKNLRICNIYNIPFNCTVTDISIQKDCDDNHTIEIPTLNNFTESISGNFNTLNNINLFLKKNSKIYISIDGDTPPNDIMVDIYIQENLLDQSSEINETVDLMHKVEPVFNEIFTLENNTTISEFPIRII
jgi:hypothetical protein